MRHGMVIDLRRCIGCNACTLACKQEKGTGPGVQYCKVPIYERGEYPLTRFEYLPLLCMHCADPPCEAVCPTGATYIREDGVVDVDTDKCIGCRYCMNACPYNARYFKFTEAQSYFEGHDLNQYETLMAAEHPVGVVQKCDLCFERTAEGEQPACVAACPPNARIWGDLDDPTSEAAKLVAERNGYQLHPEAGTNPSVFYLSE